MTSHVDAETLALSAEGLLDSDEESSVQGHLAGCAECEAELAALVDVSRLLAEAPAPELPPDVATRIEEAIRAEAEQRGAQGGGSEPSSPPDVGGDVVPFTRRPGLWLPYLVGAAAAVFVIGGAGAVLHSTLGPDSAGDAQSEVSEQGRPDTALSYQPVILESGTEYTEDELEVQAADVLADTPADAHPDASEDGTEGLGDEPQGDTPEVPADVSTCVHELDVADNESTPALVDLATFRASGSDAPTDAWVMYYGSDPDGEFEVVVVTPECADGDAASSVLASGTVAGS